MLRRRAAGDELVGEHLAEGCVVAPPAEADQVDQGLCFQPLGITGGALQRAARVGTGQDQVRHLVGVSHGVGDGHRTALRHADQRETAQAQAVDNGFEVTNPGVERKVGHRAVGQAAAALVVADVVVIACEFGQPGPPDGAVQVVFDMAQPVRGPQQRRA
ncbi:hypothetical protein FQZ97_1057700 [compost metagenome]